MHTSSFLPNGVSLIVSLYTTTTNNGLTPSLIAFLNSLVYGGLLVSLIGFLLYFVGVVDSTDRKER